jgi:hypothetical protein
MIQLPAQTAELTLNGYGVSADALDPAQGVKDKMSVQGFIDQYVVTNNGTAVWTFTTGDKDSKGNNITFTVINNDASNVPNNVTMSEIESVKVVVTSEDGVTTTTYYGKGITTCTIGLEFYVPITVATSSSATAPAVNYTDLTWGAPSTATVTVDQDATVYFRTTSDGTYGGYFVVDGTTKVDAKLDTANNVIVSDAYKVTGNVTTVTFVKLPLNPGVAIVVDGSDVKLSGTAPEGYTDNSTTQRSTTVASGNNATFTIEVTDGKEPKAPSDGSTASAAPLADVKIEKGDASANTGFTLWTVTVTNVTTDRYIAIVADTATVSP